MEVQGWLVEAKVVICQMLDAACLPQAGMLDN